AHHRHLADAAAAARPRDGSAALAPASGNDRLPPDLLPALYPGRRGRRTDLAFHVRRRIRIRIGPEPMVRRAALFLADRPNLGIRRRARRDSVEVFWLPHDALYRGAARHRPRTL